MGLNKGRDDGEFIDPHGIDFDSSDNVYVVDSGRMCMKRRIFVLYSVYFRPTMLLL